MDTILKIHPISFINAMSNALELSAVGISKHHHRTAIIAQYIGKSINLTQNELQVLIYSSLLHDIGAAADWDEKHFIAHENNDIRIFNHAEEGYNILKESPQLGVLATPIRYHHDRFNGNNPSGLKGNDIPLLSRIIHIADRIEVQIDNECHIFSQCNNIILNIENSEFFDPELVKIVKGLSETQYFWLDIVNPEFEKNFLNKLSFFGKLLFDIDDMTIIAEMFSKIIDATSHYTASHSQNVAKVAKFLAEKRSFCENEVKEFYLAGLLHDLGKLAIPNEILNKPEKLTKEEFDIIKQHPYYSQRILEQVDGFEVIAKWVGAHHETLDGKGYPYKQRCESIKLGSRIISVADVFSALIEDRPYRKGMTVAEAIKIMDNMVHNLKLDINIVDDVKKYSDIIIKLIKTSHD